MKPGMADYAKGIEKQLAQLRKDLIPLESGEMTLGERSGDGKFRDVTKEWIEHQRQVISTYESILDAIKTEKL